MLQLSDANRNKIERTINALEHYFNANCSIKGSFARKVPYPPDADAQCMLETITLKLKSNNTNIDIVSDEIYKTIIDNIHSINNGELSTDKNIYHMDMVIISCGVDKRFDLKDKSRAYKQFFVNEDYNVIHKIKDKYVTDNARNFFIDNYVYDKYYKLQFSINELNNNCKELPGDEHTTFTDELKKTDIFKIKYSIWVDGFPFNLDFVLVYNNPTIDKTNKSYPIDFYWKYASYKQEYYYLLMLLRGYFRVRRKWNYVDALNNIIENIYGINKFIIDKINQIIELCKYNLINNADFNMTYDNILNVVEEIKQQSNTSNEVKSIKTKKPYTRNMENLKQIQDELENDVNKKCMVTFYQYFKYIPKHERDNNQYYIAGPH